MTIEKATAFLSNEYPGINFEVSLLAGDASDRSFCRVSFYEPDAKLPDSAVLMVLEEPFIDGELPYLNVQKCMSAAGLPVPETLIPAPEKGFLLLEDFGDTMLEDVLQDASVEEKIRLYKMAASLMIDIQLTGTDRDYPDCIAFRLAFDVEKLMFEFNFFYEHAIGNYKQAVPTPEDDKAIRAGFLKICEILSAEPRYLTHRDYHSRNIMLKEDDTLGLVDFQDARMGPLQYDLASLLLDSYALLPDEVIDPVYEYYIEEFERRSKTDIDRDHFDNIYDYMAIQRSIKAAGSFAFLDVVKKKNRYLKNFAPVLSIAKKYILKHPRIE